MKLVRTLVAPVLTITLGLALGACKTDKPDGTSNPPDDGQAVASDGDGAGASDDGEAGDYGDAGGEGSSQAKTQCDAQVASTPTSLFGDRVLIRPPVNVVLVEDNPTFATTYQSGGFVSACDGTVDRMSLFVFQNDAKKQLGKYMDEVINDMLPKSGFAGGSRGSNHVDTSSDLHTDVEYPAANGSPPAKLYIAATRKLDYVLVVIYQTRPEEFPVLLPSFKESAGSVLVVPPDA